MPEYFKCGRQFRSYSVALFCYGCHLEGQEINDRSQFRNHLLQQIEERMNIFEEAQKYELEEQATRSMVESAKNMGDHYRVPLEQFDEFLKFQSDLNN